MKAMNLIRIAALSILFSNWAYASRDLVSAHESLDIKTHSFNWHDENRKRSIPVEVLALGKSIVQTDINTLPVVIISHGYGVKNVEYSYLASALAAQGYLVASIQHDLEDDVPLAKTGSIYERRRPMWERGTQNIMFVLMTVKAKYPGLNAKKVILIGHSNGGDISMLFAEQHPELVSKVISLDSLRYPFPRNSIPILTIRANDTQADPGVLPEKDVKIINLQEAKHIDMCDRGPDKVKNEVVKHIEKFLSF